MASDLSITSPEELAVRQAVQDVDAAFPDSAPEEKRALVRRRAERILAKGTVASPQQPEIDARAAEVAAGRPDPRYRNQSIAQQFPLIEPQGVDVGQRPSPVNLQNTLVGRLLTANQSQIEGASGLLPAAGGVFGGASGGGVPGAIGGAFLGGVLDDIITNPNPNAREALIPGSREAILEGTFTGATFGAVTLGSRILRGSKENADRIIRAMQEAGVAPTLQEVSDNFVVRNAQNIFGLFPILRKPFVKFQERRLKDAERIQDQMISALSPDMVAVRRMFDTDPERAAALIESMNTTFFDRISSAFGKLREIRDAKYGQLNSVIESINTTRKKAGLEPIGSSLDETMAAVGKAVDAFDRKTILLKARDAKDVKPNESQQALLKEVQEFLESRGGKKAASKAADPDAERLSDVPEMQAVETFLEELSRSPDRLDFVQLMELSDRVSRMIELSRGSPDAARILLGVKEGVVKDIDAMLSAHPDAAKALADAREISEEFLTLLGEAAVRRQRRVQKTFGRQTTQQVELEDGTEALKNAGTVDISRTLDEIVAKGSLSELRQLGSVLRQTFGEQDAQSFFRQALSIRLARAFERGLPTERAGFTGEPVSVFADKDAFLKVLGLDTPSNPNFLSSIEMFKQAGVDPKQIKRTVDLLDAMFGAPLQDSSQFIARRAVLGGSLIASFGAAGGFGGRLASSARNKETGEPSTVAQALGTLIGVATLRGAGRLFTSPSALRRVVALADPATPLARRSAALSSFLTDPRTLEAMIADTDTPEQVQELTSLYGELTAAANAALSSRAKRVELFRTIDATLGNAPQRGDIRAGASATLSGPRLNGGVR